MEVKSAMRKWWLKMAWEPDIRPAHPAMAGFTRGCGNSLDQDSGQTGQPYRHKTARICGGRRVGGFTKTGTRPNIKAVTCFGSLGHQRQFRKQLQEIGIANVWDLRGESCIAGGIV